METSASFDARSAPLLYSTIKLSTTEWWRFDFVMLSLDKEMRR
jgi:hypothetical protein